MLRIALIGAGRMAQAVMRQVVANADFQLAVLCVKPGSESAAQEAVAAAGIGTDLPIVSNPANLDADLFDIAMDFSLPAATASVLAAVVDAGKPLVSGVTGLDSKGLTAMRKASSRIPLLYDRNMSIGIALMQKLVGQAGAALGMDFVVSVLETHHVHKADAPSGTALKLAEAAAKSRGQEFQSVYLFDPDGFLRDQPADSVVVTSYRQGDNPGEHTVRFAGANEILELTHKVTDRRVFAEGALRAAQWLVKQAKGLYAVSDILS
ncbi:MAG: 4-hydroxy-tetrahydrodipicolinate reductase [Gammaproteobacteria bacterium]|nr:4-hydroxy-tetrahydrodipicolinate reductase [Gammaproteobacteria bacterium]MDH4314570.1 4-hydroxy-tetrahydrodipicolinate reductase [Gammaproteobacteria bacterium]MDH5213745.1 4-hydroxy-tetrahydrodipicolinate reductase [Gammaproteobacteria bacterium]MDH5500957.1 4-hydroxy-tetrahydrodipicolinate reductase [Gammaproteobacteria bacterium]